MSKSATPGALIGHAMGALAFLGLLFIAGCSRQPQLQHLDGFTMGTTWSLQYWTEEGALAELQPQLERTLFRLDKEIFSTYAEDSELSRLNRNHSQEAVKVSPELFEVLVLAQSIHMESEGAFDPTVGPLVKLWGFGPDPEQDALPEAAAIREAQARLGMASLQLVPPDTVIRTKAIELDLSGIAKGYAVDVLAESLESFGITDYLLEIGGELRVAGEKPDGSPWRLAIEAPEDGRKVPFAVMSTERAPLALAGSGDYRNYRELSGKRYSHEIDPRTGKPITHSLTAVTVVADRAAEADAWATALLVLGAEEGLRIADGLGLSAYFIIHENQGLATQSSQRFKERFSGLNAL